MSDPKNFFNLPKLPKKEDINKMRQDGLKAIQDFTDSLTQKTEDVENKENPSPVVDETSNVPVEEVPKEPVVNVLDDDQTMFDAFEDYLDKKK